LNQIGKFQQLDSEPKQFWIDLIKAYLYEKNTVTVSLLSAMHVAHWDQNSFIDGRDLDILSRYWLTSLFDVVLVGKLGE
jgi:hypothetical protein